MAALEASGAPNTNAGGLLPVVDGVVAIAAVEKLLGPNKVGNGVGRDCSVGTSGAGAPGLVASQDKHLTLDSLLKDKQVSHFHLLSPVEPNEGPDQSVAFPSTVVEAFAGAAVELSA